MTVKAEELQFKTDTLQQYVIGQVRQQITEKAQWQEKKLILSKWNK